MGVKSFFLLAYQFCLHVLRRLFFLYRPGGAQGFLENFEGEVLPPTSPKARALIPEWQRCTNCGLCEAACPLPVGQSEPGRTTYAVLAASSWRDRTATQLVVTAAQALASCGECGQCEAVCPERIPLRQLAEWVASSAARPGSAAA